jgi:methylenetetrahydrofolate reductase (NADPH)
LYWYYSRDDTSRVSQHDDKLVKDYGVTLAADMIQRLTTEGDIPGVHFCTLNLEKSVARVLELLQWTGVAASAHNKLILVCPTLHYLSSMVTFGQ